MTKTKYDKERLYYFYKLVCNDPNVKDFYVGSTANWNDRKSKHKSDCNDKKAKDYNSIKYRTIRANGGWFNWSMIEIERGIYIRREAESREYDLMAELQSTMNKQKCFNSSFKCVHDKRKQECRECEGSAFCKHDKYKRYCRECGGNDVCKHDKQKRFCKECGGSVWCKHDKHKYQCIECEGSRICDHDKRKDICPYCSPYLCECGSWTTEGNLKNHYKTEKCKAFHMKEYGRVFI